jgi:hypothetical protein
MSSIADAVPGVKCSACGKETERSKLRRGRCNACAKRDARVRNRDRTIVCHVCGRTARYIGCGTLCKACKERRYYKPKPRKELPRVTVPDEVKERYLDEILPVVEDKARWQFRHRLDRDDLVAEAMAISWGLLCREVRLGRDPFAHAMGLVVMSLRQANHYRRFCGRDPVDDALSPRANVGVEEFFGRDLNGNVYEKYGIWHDPSEVLDGGDMSVETLLELY